MLVLAGSFARRCSTDAGTAAAAAEPLPAGGRGTGDERFRPPSWRDARAATTVRATAESGLAYNGASSETMASGWKFESVEATFRGCVGKKLIPRRTLQRRFQARCKTYSGEAGIYFTACLKRLYNAQSRFNVFAKRSRTVVSTFLHSRPNTVVSELFLFSRLGHRALRRTRLRPSTRGPAIFQFVLDSKLPYVTQ